MLEKSVFNSITKQLCDLMVLSKNMEEIYSYGDKIVLERLSNEFEVKCEKLTLLAREISIKAFNQKPEIVILNAAKIQGIKVKKENEILEIELPFLLPKKNKKNSKFICDPLFYEMNKASADTTLKYEEKCVVCFIHTYKKSDKNVRPRDYDNVETKRVLDIVALFCLKDDSGEFCDIVNTMEYGDSNKTKIYIIPERSYLNWKKDRT